MRRAQHPACWLCWAGASAINVVATRNPLYLAITGLAIVCVYLRAAGSARGSSVWGLVLRISLLVGLVTVLFNTLTVHAGDAVFARLPRAIPIAGGPLTWNAVLYGLSSATAIVTLILVAAVLSAEVDQAALIRLLPPQLAASGAAAVIGLSFFPQTLIALREVREAQTARGFQVRSVRDLQPLVLPVLNLGLERAFRLAEAMESRAFASAEPDRTQRGPLLVLALALGVPALLLAATGSRTIGTLTGVIALGLAGFAMHKGRGARPARFRTDRWRGPDILVAGSALLSLLIVSLALFSSKAELSWSPYPWLAWPPFSPVVGLADLLLAAPAVLPTQSETR